MGGINIKLMQGIDDAENQLQKEKQTPKTEEKENMENETKGIQKTIRKTQTAKEQSKVKKNIAMRKNNENKTDKMLKKQVFSFRAMVSDVTVWKAYAIATGQTVESIGNNAMHEYLKKHKLSGAEQVIFDAIKTRDSNGSE